MQFFRRGRWGSMREKRRAEKDVLIIKPSTDEEDDHTSEQVFLFEPWSFEKTGVLVTLLDRLVRTKWLKLRISKQRQNIVYCKRSPLKIQIKIVHN